MAGGNQDPLHVNRHLGELLSCLKCIAIDAVFLAAVGIVNFLVHWFFGLFAFKGVDAVVLAAIQVMFAITTFMYPCAFTVRDAVILWKTTWDEIQQILGRK